MAAFLDVCRFTPSAGGTTDWTYSSAVLGYQSPAAAGAVNNAYYRYRAESADLTQWEIGYGVYNSSTGVLARTTMLFNSSGTTAKISFSSVPQVAIVALAEDLIPLIQRSALAGLTLSTAGSSSTFGVAAGAATDSTNIDVMTLASAYTKTTGAWAVGTGNGALDTGTIAASTWYHVFLTKRLDTGVVDLLISLSATAPTLPSGYTLFRRIGSMKTDGSSQWISFIQNGDEFLWLVPINDVAGAAPTAATQTSYALSVPTGVLVRALFDVAWLSSNVGSTLTIYSPLLTAQTAVPGGNWNILALFNTQYQGIQLAVRTNTSSQIAIYPSAGTSSLYFVTLGWFDTRGKDF